MGFLPDYLADSVGDIDFGLLRRRGVRYAVLDVDHTLAVYRANELAPETIRFLNAQVGQGRLERLFIASNSRRDLRTIAASISARVIRPNRLQRKPSQAYYHKLLKTIGCKPEEAVMIGDKLFNDIWGGNRAGMYTVLVKPLGPDMLVDRLLLRRYWGERYLRRHRRD